MTTTPRRSYSRQVIAAWLHGYATGHDAGQYDGRAAGFAEGYDAGHADGIPAGRRLADAEAAAKWAAYLPVLHSHRPARRAHAAAKPLATPAACLATWPTTGPIITPAVRPFAA